MLEQLKSLELPTEDYAIFGSGPMWIHGLKEDCHDLDIIARGKAWIRAAELGEMQQADMRDRVIRFFNDSIEVFNGWAPGEWDVDELIDTAQMIDGFPWVRLEYVLTWKYEMGRVKDLKDIPVIEEYLARHFPLK